MSKTTDRFTSAMLFFGGGAASYALWRWVISPRQEQPSAGEEPRVLYVAPRARHDGVGSRPPTSSRDPSVPMASSQRPSALDPSHRFDPIFERHRGSIPIEYLRALAVSESDMIATTQTGSARGLLQIVDVVRTDYNQHHGTTYTAGQLFDPEINVAIACDALRRIIDSYRRNHPDVPNLQENWKSSAFVLLLTFGWNAGFSEAAGVGRVARYLRSRGITDIDIDTVSHAAADAGASVHLTNPAKVHWCKSVVALYLAERIHASLS